MRFDIIKKYNIKDLALDEGNYRFSKASDQRECIEKIFRSSTSNFKNIMSSIAEEDIGELLLVYANPNDDKYGTIVTRCLNQMRDLGFTIVLACTEQDIAADSALSNY